MALKGAEAKQKVIQKILETFPDSFVYEKDIRIPMLENGELVQIKVALTAAKVAVSPDGESAIPGEAKPAEWNFADPKPFTDNAATPPPQPTEEEAQNIESLLKKFGF